MADRDSLQAHYGQTDLSEKIRAAMREAGLSEQGLTPEQTSAFDQLHTGGLSATRALARFGGLQEGMSVLDLGCGVGGPARALALEFGCTVTGIDLTEEFIRTARVITAMSEARHRVHFDAGDMLAMPYPDRSFDVIWSQNVTMNIEDKARLLQQIRRVVKPGGRYVFQEIFESSGEPIHLPVPWASVPEMSFLIPPVECFRLAETNGWRLLQWKDNSAESIEFQRQRLAALTSPAKDAPPTVPLRLVMGESLREKRANSLRNLEEDRVRVGHGVMVWHPDRPTS